jgi:hypothetical protein
MHPEDDEIVPVLKTTDPGLLAIARSALEAAAIPHVVQGEAGVGLFPVGPAGSQVTGRMTGASILVPRSRLEEARELLEAQAEDVETTETRSEPAVRMSYRLFRGTFKTWDELFDQATAFATELGETRVVNISHSCAGQDGVVTVWYWTFDDSE